MFDSEIEKPLIMFALVDWKEKSIRELGKAPQSLLVTFIVLSGLLCYSQTSLNVTKNQRFCFSHFKL